VCEVVTGKQSNGRTHSPIRVSALLLMMLSLVRHIHTNKTVVTLLFTTKVTSFFGMCAMVWGEDGVVSLFDFGLN